MEQRAHTLERLEDQIAWYARKGALNKRAFIWIKVLQIVSAAAIPVAVSADAPGVLSAVLGGLIVVLEGLQQLLQFQQNWTSYRSTCEALKHEKFLFLAGAGPYAAASRPDALLAERIEGLVSQEHAEWVAAREEEAKTTASGQH